MNKDEEKLVQLAKEFKNFLESSPVIPFNLHESLQVIHKEFIKIQANL